MEHFQLRSGRLSAPQPDTVRDEKHCLDGELRVVIGGREFYLDPVTADDLTARITAWGARNGRRG